ncbi:MAG TPA: hypothetical protein PKD47_11435, partial [Solirubrobacterales bacterium]|nr:hypothetical protein [Solirubrobacterales bacterium]
VPPGATRQELMRRVSEKLQIDSSVVLGRVTEAEERGSAARDAAERPASGSHQPPPPGQPVETPAGVDSPSSATGPPTALSRRERSERWLLAMCVAKPDEGREWLGKLDTRHLSSPLIERTVEWLKEHLDDPAAGLDPEDRELQKMIAALVARADPDLVGTGSIRRNYLELELAALEDEIAAAARSGDSAKRAELGRQRSLLVDQLRRSTGEPDA